jgi:hypothetical protein
LVSFFVNLSFHLTLSSTDLFIFCFAADFADEPLKIRQTILKERIRAAALRKEERNDRAIFAKVTNSSKCKKLNLDPFTHYRVALSVSSIKESPVCQHAFRNIFGIFKYAWASLKVAALQSNPGPIRHGNTNKRNRYSGSVVAVVEEDVVEFLTELGKLEGESYATRFIRERTSLSIRKDEENLLELPSSYTKRRIYAQ